METLKKYSSIFLLALLLRLIIMPFLFHPDIKSQYFHASFLQQGVFNIYQYLKENKESLPYQDSFNYPPLIYFLQGSWMIVTSPILGQPFIDWLNYWGEDRYYNLQIYRQMFVLKLPYLLADILIGLLLVKLVGEKFRKRVLIIWLFNPLTIYLIYGLSNFDILPTLFSLLALFYFKDNKYLLAGLSIGAALSLKLYPLLFLPFFILSLLTLKMYRQTFYFLLGCTIIPTVFLLPLLKDFLSNADSGLLTTILSIKITLGQSMSFPIFFILYGLILILSIKIKKGFEFLAFYILLTLFLVLSISHFHPQWFLWLIPFFAIFATQRPALLFLSLPILGSFIFSTLAFDDRFLTLGIFSPVIGNIYEAGVLEQTVFSRIDKTGGLLIAQVIFASFSLTILISIFRYINEKR